MDLMVLEKCGRTAELDPARLLDAIGVNEYSISWEERRVLLPLRYFPRVTEYFNVPTVPGQVAIQRCGWTWMLCDPLPEVA